MIFQGIRTSIAKKAYIYVIFRGGGGGPDSLPPSGSAHDLNFERTHCTTRVVLTRINTLAKKRKMLIKLRWLK